MVRPSEVKSNKATFGQSSITGYRVFPPNKSDLHKRKFKVYSTSGEKAIVTVQSFPSCSYCINLFSNCRHIKFILHNVLGDNFLKLYYDDRILDKLFKRLPGYVEHDCK